VSGAAVGTAVEPGGGTIVVGIVGAGQGAQAGAETGAVIAREHGKCGHCGIVAGPGQTVSANTAVSPAGIVTRNAWGFRPRGQNGEGSHDPAPVVRIYTGDQ